MSFFTFWLTHFAKAVCYKLTTAVTVMKLFFWGIHAGSRNYFKGVPILKCKPGSRIQIGNRNIFNSTEQSNLVGINRRCIIATHTKTANLSIGNGCGFSGTTIGAFENIEIGDNVICGGNTVITDSDWHGIKPDERAGVFAVSKPVKIERNVWLGLNAIVLKGVTIGENTVIAANSVVTKSIPANVIAGGNPCVVIKNLPSNA